MQNLASEPLISVIVAVRNASTSLASSLESLRLQTFRNFEVILVDGASTDDTLQVANCFQDIIALQISEPDSGIADAWNKGVLLARGKWITFLNAGDLIHRNHFTRAVQTLETMPNEPAILYCDALKFNTQFEISTLLKGTDPTLRRISRGSIGFPHPGSLSLKTCFDTVGMFNLSLKIAIDTDWLLRVFKEGLTFRRFDSTSYMAEGGLSDRHFKKAIQEYTHSCIQLNLMTHSQAATAVAVLPFARRAIHAYRRYLRPSFRASKHFLVGFLNAFSSLLPFNWSRRLFFSLVGFHLERGSSIALGFQFYRYGNISIGLGSVINRSCLFDNRDTIEIKDNVSISRNVSIFTAGHDPESPFFEMTTAPVFIDSHSVLFAGATIMPGVRIGKGAVVLGGAVVTKDVTPMTIVGGVPAIVVGNRLTSPIYSLNYPYPLAM